MTLSVLMSRSLVGLEAPVVRVETHLASGLPSFCIVGLADAEVRESRERVRAAIQSSGFSFPCGRLTVNLSPADLPKESGRFDLPIAIGVLLASGQIDLPELLAKTNNVPEEPALAHLVFAGELSLSGGLVPIAGAISIALAVARENSNSVLVLPASSADIAARVPSIQVLKATSLSEVILHLSGKKALMRAIPKTMIRQRFPLPCLSDVKGQPFARRALEIAAAGGHSLLMTGTPGVGKSMLASRLPGILPDLSANESLDVASIAAFTSSSSFDWGIRPFRSPHHCSSVAAMLGGGSRPRPGEVTLAHKGVLFLDEIPEFDRRVLEGLREPLETKEVCVSRARQQITFPADFQLIAARNPCPCGWQGHSSARCTCRQEVIERYQSKLSGPLLDRIDISVRLQEIDQSWLDLPKSEPSHQVKNRVDYARNIQLSRQGGTNHIMSTDSIDQYCILTNDANKLLASITKTKNLSARSIQKIKKVARTCADLAGEERLSEAHIGEAIQLRYQ